MSFLLPLPLPLPLPLQQESEDRSTAPQMKAWPANAAEREFQRFVQDGEYAAALNGFERSDGRSVRVVVARPTHASYAWLSRIDADAHAPTAKFSRDMHVQAHADGVSVTFRGERDQILALRHEERKLRRGGRFAASPTPELKNVPPAFRAQAISVARKTWELLPAAEAAQPRVEFMPASQQLEVRVVCDSGALVTYADLHQFVHATSASKAWCEATKDATPYLVVGARVPVTLAEERERERERGRERERERDEHDHDHEQEEQERRGSGSGSGSAGEKRARFT